MAAYQPQEIHGLLSEHLPPVDRPVQGAVALERPDRTAMVARDPMQGPGVGVGDADVGPVVLPTDAAFAIYESRQI